MPDPTRVVVVNRGTDQITFELPIMDGRGDPKRDAQGRPMMEEYLLGSTEDVGNPEAPQPELELDAETWARLKAQPGVAGLVREQKIAAYAKGAEV